MNRPLALGIEIGGTKLQVGLGRRDGSLLVLERRRIDPARGASGILEQIRAATARLLIGQSAMSSDLAAVGIGFGGPVDAGRGVVVVSNQVEGWAGFPLAEWVRAHLGVEAVALENDAATAALGEARFGAGVGHDPVLYLTIGSGVGGGLVVGGEIYRGSGRGAIEIGHLIVARPAGDPGPGRTLESVAAGWSIARAGQQLIAAKQFDPAGALARLCVGRAELVTSELVAQAATEGDAGASAILTEARTVLGQALAQAITLLAPRRVILGGGVSSIGEELWFEPIRHEVDRRVFPPFRGTFDIVPARLGEEVVIHGALALAADAARRDRESC